MKNIVIVGAGSAGWMTALFINKLYPNAKVTVIGSKEIGILGAGEGTVPNITNFLRCIDIRENDLVKRCKSTLKSGIKFKNWHKDQETHYYHNFQFPSLPIKNKVISKLHADWQSFPTIDINCYINNKNINEYDLLNACLENKQIPIEKQQLVNHISNIPINTALHFDAHLIAQYFSEVGISRGIIYKDLIITDFELNDAGEIKSISTNQEKIDCDFVFDCSGFKRLIIGNLYKSKWKSVENKLPVNKAIPFFLPPDEKLDNYTTATAMNHGWCWKIPLQHRSGCGYVYDSSSCTDEEAKKELYDKFGTVEIPRSFSFNSGHYEDLWIKNCIAIGLSTGFLEPLEATSIWTSTMMLFLFAQNKMAVETKDQSLIDDFNRNVSSIYDSTIDFIQFHYLNGRSDTLFWRKVNSGEISDKMSNNFLIWKNRLPIPLDVGQDRNVFFSVSSWIKVGMGIGFFDKQMVINYKKSYSDLLNFDLIDIRQIDKMREKFITHEHFLKFFSK